jgi:hypothetical protein
MPVCKTSAGTNKEQRKPKFSAAELLLHYASKCLRKSAVQQSALIAQTFNAADIWASFWGSEQQQISQVP